MISCNAKRRALALVIGLTASAPAFADTLDGSDTAWILTATALVLFMTIPGLSLFYGGLVRAKNVLSVLMQCFVICCLASVIWLVAGYSLAFGDGGGMNEFIGGLDNLFMAGIGEDTLSGTIPESSFALFQMTFAIITPALIIGGFAERMRFSAVLIFTTAWLLLVYAPICHWVWGGGWLGDLGVMDFAGGIVVHITAGVAALVAAIMLGSRRGFPDQALMPHNMTLTIMGAGMLWVGWFGFNGGSALAASPLAASALPPLKPNQPTHIMPAPITVMVMLCGGIAVSGKPRRGPSTIAATRAATPQLICTTVPPAKSYRPISPSQPPPHTQWVIGT